VTADFIAQLIVIIIFTMPAILIIILVDFDIIKPQPSYTIASTLIGVMLTGIMIVG